MSQLEMMMRGRVAVAVVIVVAVLFQCDVVVQGAKSPKTYVVLWGPNPNFSAFFNTNLTENDVVEFKNFGGKAIYSVAKVNMTGFKLCDSSKGRFGNILNSGDDKFGLAEGINYFIGGNLSLCEKGKMRLSLFASKWK